MGKTIIAAVFKYLSTMQFSHVSKLLVVLKWTIITLNTSLCSKTEIAWLSTRLLTCSKHGWGVQCKHNWKRIQPSQHYLIKMMTAQHKTLKDISLLYKLLKNIHLPIALHQWYELSKSTLIFHSLAQDKYFVSSKPTNFTCGTRSLYQ